MIRSNVEKLSDDTRESLCHVNTFWYRAAQLSNSRTERGRKSTRESYLLLKYKAKSKAKMYNERIQSSFLFQFYDMI